MSLISSFTTFPESYKIEKLQEDDKSPLPNLGHASLSQNTGISSSEVMKLFVQPEIGETILKFMDFQAIGRMRCTSKEWNALLAPSQSSDVLVWKFFFRQMHPGQEVKKMIEMHTSQIQTEENKWFLALAGSYKIKNTKEYSFSKYMALMACGIALSIAFFVSLEIFKLRLENKNQRWSYAMAICLISIFTGVNCMGILKGIEKRKNYKLNSMSEQKAARLEYTSMPENHAFKVYKKNYKPSKNSEGTNDYFQCLKLEKRLKEISQMTNRLLP